MSTHLLLEGTDLHVLLAEVRAQHGETARIVKAERIRSGGVAGFFSKERYEVTVELPEGGSAASLPARGADEVVERVALPVTGTAGPDARSLGDLLAVADAADGADRLSAMIAAGAGPRTAPAPDLAAQLESAFRSVNAPAPTAPAPRPAEREQVAHRPISTEGAEFAFTLASMRRHLTDGTPSTAPNVTPVVPSVTAVSSASVIGGRHAVPTTEDPVSPEQFGPSNGVASPHRAGERAYAESMGYEQSHGEVREQERAEGYSDDYSDHYGERFDTPAPRVEEPRREEPRREESRLQEPRREEVRREEPRRDERFEAPRERETDRPDREAREPRAAYRDDVTTYSDRQAPRRATFRDGGDPADVLRLAREIDVPTPLRVGAGEIVLVVGEADAVVSAGLLVADDIGSEAPLVMGRADVHATVTADELPLRQEQARRWSAPLTVVVPARPTGADAERAARLAANVGAAVVVVCVDATRRSHAVGGLLRALDQAGVPARRLSVHRAAESPDPLDVLSLDVPVGFLDGRPATSGAWAGLLLDATSELGGLPGR